MLDNENVPSEDNPVEELDYFLPEGYAEEDEMEGDEPEVEEPATEEEGEKETGEPVEEESDEKDLENSEGGKEELPPLEDTEIKVLGEIKKLSDIPREELQSVVRKGEDYDRVKEKLTTVQAEIDDWHEIAEMFDMKPAEVIETLRDQHFKQIAESEDRNVEDVKKLYESNRKSKTDKQYEKFVSKYQDVNVDELPQEVKDDVAMGKDITASYEKYMYNAKSSEKDSKISELESKIAELEKASKVKEQNAKSKQKGVVRKTTGSDKTNNDDFLSGFLD